MSSDVRTESLIVVTGAHCDPRLGATASEIEAEGFEIARRVPLGDGPMSDQMARDTQGVGEAFRELTPDAALVLGDRYEALAAATAIVAEGGFLAHLHGGEITTGAIDNQFRYAITALAHLHLVATKGARTRLVAMGERPERVIVTGAPGLDGVVAPLAAGHGSSEPFVLVTLHSETLGGDPEEQARTLIEALDRVGRPCVITGANADPGGETINTVLRDACEQRENWTFEMNLGATRYREAMTRAACMVGNSSSGIIEAASFGLRVVNIGSRQDGRERSGNVADVAWDAEAIATETRRAIDAGRWSGDNVYGDGRASERIVEALATVDLTDRTKPFSPPSTRLG